MITRGDFNRTISQIQPLLSRNTVIGLDTSASLLGLTNVREYPITLVTTSEEVESTVDVAGVEVILVEEPLNNGDIVIINSLICTSPERTIIDLLRYDRDPQIIVESLAYYYHSLGQEDWGNLPQLMRQHDLYEEFETYVEDAEEYYNN